MGEKDIAEKVLEDYNDVFADIVNVLLLSLIHISLQAAPSATPTASAESGK